MMRLLAFATVVSFAAALVATAQDELPQSDDNETLDIEPPLLIHNGAPLPDLARTSLETTPPLDRVRTLLDRARQSAATGERLCRAGIIARVQVEERVLKVVRLEAEFAAAELGAAREELAARQHRFDAGEIQKPDLDQAAAAVTAATETAGAAAAARNQSELDFAAANLRRQQKLLALGSARKADVDRAAEKLASLAQKRD